MMKDKNFPFKFPRGGRIEKRRNKYHSFSDLRSLNLRNNKIMNAILFLNNNHNKVSNLLQGEGSRLAATNFFNWHPLTVYAFNSDGSKLSNRIRPKE